MMEGASSIKDDWQTLLQELALAADYHLAYEVSGSPVSRNPVLDQLLPSFGYLRLASFADEALAGLIDNRGLACTHESTKGKKTHSKGDLFNRTECLLAHRVLTDKQAEVLHRIRNRRKPLAHEAQPEAPTWQELGTAIVDVESVLAAHGLVESGVRYTAVATQHQAGFVEGKNSQQFTLAACTGGKAVREISWRIEW
jgi:hypothetical protein